VIMTLFREWMESYVDVSMRNEVYKMSTGSRTLISMSEKYNIIHDVTALLLYKWSPNDMVREAQLRLSISHNHLAK